MTEAAGFPGDAVVPPRALRRRCRHTKVRTHRQRTLAASSSVCAPQRKAACGLFTAHAASRPTRVKGGRRTRLVAQDGPTSKGVGGKGRGRRHAAHQQNRHGMPPPPTEGAGEREGVRVLFVSSTARPSARRLHVAWDLSPFRCDMGCGVRAASLAGLRQPAVPFNPRGRAHARYLHWPACLDPHCSCAATDRFRSGCLRRRSRIRPRSKSAVD